MTAARLIVACRDTARHRDAWWRTLTLFALTAVVKGCGRAADWITDGLDEQPVAQDRINIRGAVPDRADIPPNPSLWDAWIVGGGDEITRWNGTVWQDWNGTAWAARPVPGACTARHTSRRRWGT